MILHSGHKTKWITQSLKEDHREHVVAMFKVLFKEEYQHLAPAPAPEPDRSPTSHLDDDDYYGPPEDLAKMALDYLTIPSTACECERCFSRTTIGTQRHSLRAETIQMLACSKIWVRNKRV
ncbi:uncharacterized protein FRV6_16747 [Fusarium oxysporum]|uniref:HAT C-terminal dimerisation domain-containing protein n=1 Tax=Fusarium oxysporum TaxID=5507 RepID=A0A2H3UFM8_FUSOX|nr:uncharacterized protein FRV6_16747 [Fusarium oxysporum]